MSGDAWQHLHTIGCFATALSLIQSPPSPSPSLPPNSPSLKHFQIHLQLLPLPRPFPENMHQRIFFHGASKKGEGMLLLQYFTLHRRANGAKSIITSSCWKTVARRISLKMSMRDIYHLCLISRNIFGPWVPWAKEPKLSHDHFYCDSYFSQTMFVWHLLGQEVPDVLFAHLVKTTPIPATH